jgi:DNA-binding beta-propeller fold protein YncE
MDALGRIWVAAQNSPGVFRLDPDGTMSLVAGTRGRFAASGDGGPALRASFIHPSGAALDPLGRLLIADQPANTLRRVDAAGNISTVASIRAYGVHVSVAGAIYVTDRVGGRVLQLNADDSLTLVASGLSGPAGVITDASGAIFVAEESGHRVTRIASDGVTVAVVGTGVAGFGGDGGLATAALLNQPTALALAPDGALYIAEFANNRVRRVGVDGIITTIAGTGAGASSGDGGPAVDAALNAPRGVVIDPQGNLIIADGESHLLRRVDVHGRITSIAGLLGDFDEPLLSRVANPHGFAFDGSGALILADRNFHRLRRFDLVTSGPTAARTIVGDAPHGFGGDGGDARIARLFAPRDVALFDDGRLILVDAGNRRLRMVDAAGVMTTILGDGRSAPLLDGALATESGASPHAVAIAPDTSVCFVDAANHAVACVDPIEGRLNVVAGGRGPGNTGDDGPAHLAQLREPDDLAFDEDGALFIADTGNHVIRRIDLTSGIITRVVGTGVAGNTDGPPLTASLSRPVGVALGPDGRLCIADAGNRRIRCLSPADGLLHTVAGTGAAGIAGDGGLAVEASLGEMNAIGFDPEGRLHISGDGFSNSGEHRVRRIDHDGSISTVVGQVHPPGNGSSAVAQLYGPSAMALLGSEQLLSVGALGRLQRWDMRGDEVEVAVGYDSASGTVQGLAGFAPLLQGAAGIAYDPTAGQLFVSEEQTGTLRFIDVGPVIAGEPAPPSSWSSRSVPTALAGPAGLALVPDSDELIVADTLAHCVRRVARTGDVLGTVFGNCGTPGVLPGFLNRPSHVAVSPATGAIYVADTGNHRVLRLDDVGVSVVVGDGSVSSAGEGAPARQFPVNAPRQLALDVAGNLYVASATTIRQVVNVDGDADADGDDRVVTIYGGGSRVEAPESDTFCLHALVATPTGTVYAGDACHGFLVRVAPVIEP